MPLSILCAFLCLLSSCKSTTQNEITVESSATPFPDGSTPEPAPFGMIESAFVGLSGSYPYVLFYDQAFTCDQLEGVGGEQMPDESYNSLLILVGGDEEGIYPVYDVIGSTGAYSLDGNAIAYVSERRGNSLLSVDYARGGEFLVDSISEILTRATGSFYLEFDWGHIEGDYVVTEYCDVY